MRAAALALCALLGGCAGLPLHTLGLPQPRAELVDTPFFPQEDYQCGPAALATVLAHGGVAVTPAELTPQLFIPGRRGSVQPEVLATARRYGRVPYVLPPRLADVLATVAGGTPVLVLQNLGLSWWPVWHYAVVVGFDAAADTVVLRSGTERRHTVSAATFERTWARSRRWAVAIVAPDAIPRAADLHGWLRAASAFEELRQRELAASAYAAAARRWPEAALPWQVLANARHGGGDLRGAEAALREALRREASVTTLNNLASVLLERGCRGVARDAIERAGALGGSAAEQSVVARTRAQIEAHRGRLAKDCAPLPASR